MRIAPGVTVVFLLILVLGGEGSCREHGNVYAQVADRDEDAPSQKEEVSNLPSPFKGGDVVGMWCRANITLTAMEKKNDTRPNHQWPNGNVGIRYSVRNGKTIVELYDRDGVMLARGEEKDHLATGKWLWLGDTTVHCEYDAGKITGVCTVIDRSGRISSVVNYSEGKEHGPAYYYTDGRLTVMETLSHGQPNGLRIAYDENGLVEFTERYIDGKKVEPDSEDESKNE